MAQNSYMHSHISSQDKFHIWNDCADYFKAKYQPLHQGAMKGWTVACEKLLPLEKRDNVTVLGL